MKEQGESKVLYESFYKQAGHFSFGANWRDFLESLSPGRMKIVETSLETFLGKNSIKGKSFIDIGCGSGIFSLAAYRQGAAKVVSVDVDASSVSCAKFLQKEEGSPKNWHILEGSALNTSFVKGLGRFDIVYSWGVLHHTGDMYSAIKNASTLVAESGQFYIAIYNHSKGLKHGKSGFWLRFKRHYNQSNRAVKQLYVWLYSAYLVGGLTLSGVNPLAYIRNYQSARGMSWKHDILDWLGGYPYEYATPEEIIAFVSDLGFSLRYSTLVNSIGCNEYVFVKNRPVKNLPEVTVLLSVHNNGKTLDKTLKSVFDQTLRPKVICINDASTDSTAEVLAAWQKKMGVQIEVLVNKKNLGLTKSLNKGLKHITTPYTARIDADDWWIADKLEKQVNFLEANRDYGVVGCYYTNHGHTKATTHTPPVTDQSIRRNIINLNPFAHSSVLFRTELIRELGGYDENVRYGQDYELWLRCLPKAKFFNLPLNLCHRSFTGGISIEKQHDQMYYALKTRRKYIRKYNMPLVSYLSLVEPWLVRITPRWLADTKRKFLK